MKPLNVFLFDHDNRDVVSLIYHYARFGHRVFLPKPGTEGFGKTPTWPRLLLKSSSDPSRRNIEIHGFETSENVKFGEDRFLETELDEILQKLYEEDVSCELVDFSKEMPQIDVWHSLPNTITSIDGGFAFAGKHFPHARWVSSCMTHWDHTLRGSPKNLVKFLPANYVDLRPDLNQTPMYRHRIEFTIQNVRDEGVERNGWASFNHNFSVRQPTHHELQKAVNAALAPRIQIVNHGGNIRSHGADTKYSGVDGITGKDPTLSPRQAMKRYTQLRGVLHLKQTDWAGGVPAMCRFAGTPLVTLGDYVRASRSEKVLVHGKNCLIAERFEDIVEFVRSIDEDDKVFSTLSQGMLKTDRELHDDAYWLGWERFLGRLI